jgi:anthranilate phosphoribosyltransferase
MIRDAIKKAVTGQDLSETEAEGAVHDILSGKATFAQAGALLTALRMKGETVDEITGAARAIQSRVIKLHLHNGLVNLDRDDINIEEETILQTCDTGANGTHTFNVSTATAFVVAGGGIRVARHGDRVISRRFGAADVLEHLGVKLDLPRSAVERCIEELNIGFIFGPLFKEPMRTLGGLRGEIGIRTIFNLVGPLSNPTNASTHVLGVYDPSLTEKMAHVFNQHLWADESLPAATGGDSDIRHRTRAVRPPKGTHRGDPGRQREDQRRDYPQCPGRRNRAQERHRGPQCGGGLCGGRARPGIGTRH